LSVICIVISENSLLQFLATCSECQCWPYSGQ